MDIPSEYSEVGKYIPDCCVFKSSHHIYITWRLQLVSVLVQCIQYIRVA
jgi:hypothetical protein